MALDKMEMNGDSGLGAAQSPPPAEVNAQNGDAAAETAPVDRTTLKALILSKDVGGLIGKGALTLSFT